MINTRVNESWKRVVSSVRAQMLIHIGRSMPGVRLAEITVRRIPESVGVAYVSIQFRDGYCHVSFDEIEQVGFVPIITGVNVEKDEEDRFVGWLMAYVTYRLKLWCSCP